MTYKKGMVQWDLDYTTGHENEDGDWVEESVASLPHSCDEWVIGGVDEIDLLIEDLTSLLRSLEADHD